MITITRTTVLFSLLSHNEYVFDFRSGGSEVGVDIYVLEFLMNYKSFCIKSGLPSAFGHTLTLGRQGLHIPSERRSIADSIVSRHFCNSALSDVVDDSPWSDKLFRFLGSTSLNSMDCSSFEGADFVHDLGTPVGHEFYERFDCVFDGGTLEHVLNIPVAFANVGSMLKENGIFITVNAANNMLGHGMYQFSPELLWTVFSSANGFHVEIMHLMDLDGSPSGRDAVSPRQSGRRIEIGRT